MKNTIKALLALALMAGVFSSCSEDNIIAEGQGDVNLDVKLNAECQVGTRATNEAALAENCIVYVYNTKGLIRKYKGTNTLPSKLTLKSGNYRVTAAAGDSVPASFTDRYFKGEKAFVVSAGAQQQVNVECKIANSVVVVDFGNIAEALNDYQIKVSNEGGDLVFNADNADSRGYFMMDAEETNLYWTISGTQKNGGAYEQCGAIENVKPTTLYTLSVNYKATQQEFGGVLFEIGIEDEEIITKPITITAAPKFLLNGGLDVNAPIVTEPAKFVSSIGVYCTSACALKSLLVAGENSLFTSELALPDNEFDFFTMDDTYRSNLETLGVSCTYDYNAEQDNAIAKVTLAKELLNKLGDGNHQISFTATDVKNKVRNYVLTIQITNASVVTIDIIEADVYTSRATIYGAILKENETGHAFRYRVAGTSDWTTVTPTINGESMSAALTGLTSGTTYEYQAICDGFTLAEVKTFTTEEARQLPNSSFEDWQTNVKAYLLYAAGGEMFWDTGNHGSSSMNKNVTVPCDTIFHSGSRSVDLQSQFVGLGSIGKFAAGNLFIGKYLKTDGTDGILGWGRPFFSRPTKLTGYVNYKPQTINNNSGAVEGATGMDKGQIYIALWDESTETDSSTGETWPKIIRTKSSNRSLFDANSEHIIGYGQITFTEAHPGNEMVPFTIEIEYRQHKKPSAIIMTCSASMYGDYFCGGSGSRMLIDDLQLIYE